MSTLTGDELPYHIGGENLYTDLQFADEDTVIIQVVDQSLQYYRSAIDIISLVPEQQVSGEVTVTASSTSSDLTSIYTGH
jgi:hypothetical protein